MPESDKNQPVYLCVMGDLVKSRKSPDRALLQSGLKRSLAVLNERFSDRIVGKFMIDRGDSFQGLMRADTPFDEVWWTYHEIWWTDPHLLKLKPATRFGLAWGGLDTPIQHDRVVEADGPCFHRARAALESAEKHRHMLALDPGVNTVGVHDLAVLASVLAGVTTGWSNAQKHTVALARSLDFDPAAVAEQRATSVQNVYRLLDATDGQQVVAAWRSLARLARVLRSSESTETD